MAALSRDSRSIIGNHCFTLACNLLCHRDFIFLKSSPSDLEVQPATKATTLSKTKKEERKEGRLSAKKAASQRRGPQSENSLRMIPVGE